MKVTRKLIEIDEELCNGCGQCVPSCAEGAIQLIDGKARLVAEKYCDGLGACLGECPQGALKITEREAEDFDYMAVEEYLNSQSQPQSQPQAMPKAKFKASHKARHKARHKASHKASHKAMSKTRQGSQRCRHWLAGAHRPMWRASNRQNRVRMPTSRLSIQVRLSIQE